MIGGDVVDVDNNDAFASTAAADDDDDDEVALDASIRLLNSDDAVCCCDAGGVCCCCCCCCCGCEVCCDSDSASVDAVERSSANSALIERRNHIEQDESRANSKQNHSTTFKRRNSHNGRLTLPMISVLDTHVRTNLPIAVNVSFETERWMVCSTVVIKRIVMVLLLLLSVAAAMLPQRQIHSHQPIAQQ
jgi:hypothetical protein